MKSLLSALSSVAFLSLLGTPDASASTLISNLGQPNVNAAQGYFSTTIRYAWDFETGANAASVAALTMRLLNLDSIPHHITSQIWSNNGSNLPGSLVGSFSNVTVAGNNSVASNYTTSPTTISLAPNTTYWIVAGMAENLANYPFGPGHQLVSTGQAVDAGGEFATVAGTDFLFSGDSGATWTMSASENAYYKLEGSAVPEPTTAFLLAAAAPLVIRRRR